MSQNNRILCLLGSKKYPEIASLVQNLLQHQKDSFENFLQISKSPEDYLNQGLHEIFSRCFPVQNKVNNLNITLEYINYELRATSCSPETAKEKKISYTAPLYIQFKLTIFDGDKCTDSVQENLCMGNIPIMTDAATFILNGVERSVICQAHKSSGLFFDKLTHEQDARAYTAKIIPSKGSWIDIEFDARDHMYFRIDRKKRISAAAMLLGLDNEETYQSRLNKTFSIQKSCGLTKTAVLKEFYTSQVATKIGNNWQITVYPKMWINQPVYQEIYNIDGKVICSIKPRLLEHEILNWPNTIMIHQEYMHRFYLASDCYIGEERIYAGHPINDLILENFSEIEILNIIASDLDATILHSLNSDHIYNQYDALHEIVKSLKAGETVPETGIYNLLHDTFFDPTRYSLSTIGRNKLNSKTGNTTDLLTLTRRDIFDAIRILLKIRNREQECDDIDSLCNRRIRLVGEILENYCRPTILKMSLSAKEKIAANAFNENENLSPSNILLTKPLIIAIKEFFTSSQLSQMSDQANLLAEISHKNRITSVGQGAANKEFAGQGLRNVQQSQNGRICPFETPDGLNVGLVNSRAVHAKINRFGFLEAQYKVVKNCQVTDEIISLTSSEEENKYMAHCAAADEDGKLYGEIECFYNGEIVKVAAEKVNLIDLSPYHSLSIATSMIPFLECNDPARALMGANMQRQAIPLLTPECPLVCTGMEKIIARDSGSNILVKEAGEIIHIDSEDIFIMTKTNVQHYRLKKFSKSNAATLVNQRPIKSLKVGDYVEENQIIAESTSTDKSEAAIGKNLTIAFMPFYGYNFEDAAIVSSRVADEDLLTAIRIHQYETATFLTQLGSESFTSDIPNIQADMLNNLYENGLVRLGTYVKPGDILVGKVTPKSEVSSTPEENLLRSVFGEKAANVQDVSLRMPNGAEGIVTRHTIVNKIGYADDQEIETSKEAEEAEVIKIYTKCFIAFENYTRKSLNDFSTNFQELLKLHKSYLIQYENLKKEQEKAIDAVARVQKIASNELQPSIVQTARVLVADKRKIQAGDKVAGRHGNKCVISRIEPKENMPYMEDGTVIDIIFNSLGVPSRMNVGQIFETELGLIAVKLQERIKIALKENNISFIEEILLAANVSYTDPIEAAQQVEKHGLGMLVMPFIQGKQKDIAKLRKLAGTSVDGQYTLYDGKTSEAYANKITVGKMYVMRLNHDVSDKMHARSTGPYALIHQQPLGGRSQAGGQKLGEMEQWAFQGHGAAYNNSEIGVKSDDVEGRLNAYSAFIRGDDRFTANIPESYKMFKMFIESLGLTVKEQLTSIPVDFGKIANYSLTTDILDRTIQFKIATPAEILKRSHGKIESAETHSPRHSKPINGGLFCSRIFGPVNNYECICGKYKGMKYKGIVCEKCNVEIMHSKVRRERVAHIELETPIVHVWFMHVLPSKIGMLLNMNIKTLESILSCQQYVIIEPGNTAYQKDQLISSQDYQQLRITQLENVPDLLDENLDIEDLENIVKAQTGGRAILYLLSQVNLEEEKSNLEQELFEVNSIIKHHKIVKKLQLVKGMLKSGTKPEHFIVKYFPVLPAGMRPIASIENTTGTRTGTLGVNEGYKLIVSRNLHLLYNKDAPETHIINNQECSLQQICDSVFDNGRNGNPQLDKTGKKLKGIANHLQGKTGMCRQEILGKRIDYSGRSVIVVGPELKLNQCGVPREMALELFKPFVLAKIEATGLTSTIKGARKLVEEKYPQVWDILEDVIKYRPVLLNRAPTLHRLSIQAFDIVLTDGKALKLHPLVCAAFNADFDGDNMNISIPLSIEARAEAHCLMYAPNNILSPANGLPVITPSQDIVLGINQLTVKYDWKKKSKQVFSSFKAVITSLQLSEINPQEIIEVYHCGKKIETTVGRVYFYYTTTHNFDFEEFDKSFTKKCLSKLFLKAYKMMGKKGLVKLADEVKDIGFYWSTHQPISIGINDFVKIPGAQELINEADQQVLSFTKEKQAGFITESEYKSKKINTWVQCTDKATELMNEHLKKPLNGRLNSFYIMSDSGARGSPLQMRQIFALRGPIQKDSEIQAEPVRNNYMNGLTSVQAFNSTHGTRQGSTNTALKTAEVGYLTRKAVEVCQDSIISSFDCKTKQGIKISAIIDDLGIKVTLAELALGRILAEDALDNNNNIIIPAGKLIGEEEYKIIDNSGLNSLTIRSPIKCTNHTGICAQCYGLDLAEDRIVAIGEAVGIIAAQSIGEPATQLTMNTFHTGGIAQGARIKSSITAPLDGIIEFKYKTILNLHNENIVISRDAQIILKNSAGSNLIRSNIPYGAKIYVKDQEFVSAGMFLAQWDSFNKPIIAEFEGYCELKNIVEGINMLTEVDEITGISHSTIIENANVSSLKPRIEIHSENKTTAFNLPNNAILLINKDCRVQQGQILGNIPKGPAQSYDITGGIVRINDLLEAREDKNHAILSPISGMIDDIIIYKNKYKVLIKDDMSELHELSIVKSASLIVQIDDYVRVGDALTDGPQSPHAILQILGVDALSEYLLDEIQDVYRSQGAQINNKHVEIIIRQMLQKHKIVDPGQSEYLSGQLINYYKLLEENKILKERGMRPIQSIQILMGITNATINHESLLAALSFQDFTRLLCKGCLEGQVDKLDCIKSCVIAGNRLIPAGTGYAMRNLTKQRIKELIKNKENSSINNA